MPPQALNSFLAWSMRALSGPQLPNAVKPRVQPATGNHCSQGRPGPGQALLPIMPPGPNGAAILAGSSPWVGKVTTPVLGPWGALRKKMPDRSQGTLMLSGPARWELAALSPLGSRQG